MSVRVMTLVWAIDLPASQKIVLLALADCANDEGLAWPGMASLSRKCSKSERTVQTMLAELETAGHITREQVPGKGCRYTVHPRKNCTPAETAPPQNLRQPPQISHPTPAKSAPKPSKNHQEPSEVKSPASDDTPLTVEEVVEDWNALAAELDLPTVRSITPARRRAFKARLREYPDIADWQRAFATIRGSPFLRGDNNRGWRADFDFLLQAKSFTKLTEEAYGQTQRRVA